MSRPQSFSRSSCAVSPWTVAEGGLSRLLSDVVGHAAATSRSIPPSAAAPRLSAWEAPTFFELAVDLPGLTNEQIKIEFLDDALTISGDWNRPEPAEESTPLRDERTRGEFSRTVRFPVEIDSSAISADLSEGVLTVRLPKRPETAPRKIEIGGGNRQSLSNDESTDA